MRAPRVPEGNGLGVELDASSMKRWAAHFVEHGPMGHFTDPALPGHYRRLPLN